VQSTALIDQAIAQVCAFSSPERGILRAVGMTLVVLLKQPNQVQRCKVFKATKRAVDLSPSQVPMTSFGDLFNGMN
jgi:hypothetical protein